uniref:Uncharacterized protein n=1 Tax=Ciona intestinalis TaxID=7719 RepID=H2XYP2_CIOIN
MNYILHTIAQPVANALSLFNFALFQCVLHTCIPSLKSSHCGTICLCSHSSLILYCLGICYNISVLIIINFICSHKS